MEQSMPSTSVPIANDDQAPQTRDITKKTEKPKKPQPLKEVTNFIPLVLCIAFFGATALYFYVRFTYTLNLGSLLWYGYLVLSVECIGVLAVAPYAILLTRSTLPDDTAGLPAAKVPLPYEQYESPETRMHVRILVPCYKEDLEVITATVNGAREADLPEGVARTIYLCDDGKDPKKRAFIDSLGEEAVYVTGRIRKAGEINGKSNNLNNCIKNHCYKKYLKEGEDELDWHAIPTHELLVIFDADMVAGKDFFLRVLQVMQEEDIALCLTPQAFHNIDPSIDLFNNCNIQFWEYWLPGANGQKYIACTGTNFCIRGRPLAHCGLFPTYTITEDYALGMELKRKGYKGTYLLAYVAKGEAPDEVRNVMRQRSRWTKGHMQVFFDWRHNPLVYPGLPFAQRLWYCYGTYSYFATVATTPTFLLLPFLGLLFGIYPVSINWWFALSVSIYYSTTFLIQSYVNKGDHVMPLWFAGIANQVLCFTFFKAILNVLISNTGWKQVGFKATEKKTTQATTAPGPNILGNAGKSIASVVRSMSMRVGSRLKPAGHGPAIDEERQSLRQESMIQRTGSSSSAGSFVGKGGSAGRSFSISANAGTMRLPSTSAMTARTASSTGPVPASRLASTTSSLKTSRLGGAPGNAERGARQGAALPFDGAAKRTGSLSQSISVPLYSHEEEPSAPPAPVTRAGSIMRQARGVPQAMMSSLTALRNQFGSTNNRRQVEDEQQRLLEKQQKNPLLGGLSSVAEIKKVKKRSIWSKIRKSLQPQNVAGIFVVLDPLVLILAFLICVVTFAAGIYRFANPTANQSTAYVGVPMMWAIYQSVPFYLFIHYTLTSGPTFATACKIGHKVQILAGIASMVFLWFNIPTAVDTETAIDFTSSFFSQQRSGDLSKVRAFVPSWRGNSFVNDTVPGGFFVDGTHVKYTAPMATALTFMVWSLLEFPGGLSRANRRQILSDVRWGGQYLMDCYSEEGGIPRFVARIGDPTDYFTDDASIISGSVWTNPEDDPLAGQPKARTPYIMTSDNPGVDVLGDAAAGLAAAAIALAGEDSTFSSMLLRTAVKVYNMGRAVPAGEEKSVCNWMQCTKNVTVQEKRLKPRSEHPEIPPICWGPDLIALTCKPLYTKRQCTKATSGTFKLFQTSRECCDALQLENIWEDLETPQGICALPSHQTQCFIPDITLGTCVSDSIDTQGMGCQGEGLEIYPSVISCCNRIVKLKATSKTIPSHGTCGAQLNSCWVPLITLRTCMPFTDGDCISRGIWGAYNTSVGCCERLHRLLIAPTDTYSGSPLSAAKGICKSPWAPPDPPSPPPGGFDDQIDAPPEPGPLLGRKMKQDESRVTAAGDIAATFANQQPTVEYEEVDVLKEITFFNSTSVLDDMAWGGTWLYLATRREEFLGTASEYLRAHLRVETKPDTLNIESKYFYPSWDNLAWATQMLLATETQHDEYIGYALLFLRAWIGKPLQEDVRTANEKVVAARPPESDIVVVTNKDGVEELCKITEAKEVSCEDDKDNDCDGLIDYADPDCPFTPIEYTTHGFAWTPDEPLPQAAQTAFLALLYAKHIPMADRRSLLLDCWALGQVRFMLGVNGQSFFVGTGMLYPKQVHHRAASCDIVKNPPCNWYSGYYPDAENPHPLLGALTAGPDFDEKYVDVRSHPNSRIGLHYTAVLHAALSGLLDRDVTIQKCSTYNGLYQDWFGKPEL